MLEYLSAFGIGATVSVLAQFCLTFYKDKRTLQFQEKKEAYCGLIEAIRLVATSPSNENKKMFGHWHIRCELVGNAGVCSAIKRAVESPSGSQKQELALDDMKSEMRKDLGIAK